MRARPVGNWIYLDPDVQGGLVVTDVSESSGIQGDSPTRCHGSAFFDYDEDGDVDLYLNDGGPEWLPGTAQGDRLWRNESPPGHFATLSLEGVVSNRGAVHARAVALTSSGREVWRRLTAGKGFGGRRAGDLPLLFAPLFVPLGAEGRLALPIPVSGDPLVNGVLLRIQALVLGAGSERTLTNTVIVEPH